MCVPVYLSAEGWGLIFQIPTHSLLPQERRLNLPSANSESQNIQTLTAWRQITAMFDQWEMAHGKVKCLWDLLRSVLGKAWAWLFGDRGLWLSRLTCNIAAVYINLSPVLLWPRGWADAVSLPCEKALSYRKQSPFTQTMLHIKRGCERSSYPTWRTLRGLLLPSSTISLKRR